MQTARQVDYLHNAIREIPGAEETELPGADPSHPAQMEELHAELDHQPPSAGGAPHPLQAMGAIGRSSGMRALLMQQNEVRQRTSVCTRHERAYRGCNQTLKGRMVVSDAAKQGAAEWIEHEAAAGVAQPSVAQPGVSQPGVAQPSVAQPEVAQPDVA
eukprot:1159628-Pelagomonas_calceolata.AAC.4